MVVSTWNSALKSETFITLSNYQVRLYFLQLEHTYFRSRLLIGKLQPYDLVRLSKGKLHISVIHAIGQNLTSSLEELEPKSAKQKRQKIEDNYMKENLIIKVH